MEFLEGKAREIAERVILEEEARRKHLVICLSGAHAYGFPSPDSDLDLKAIHLAPTRNLLGLKPEGAVSDRLEVIEGVEIDYTSNELRGVLHGILQGNGNYIERVLGKLLPYTAPELQELQELLPKVLSRRVHRHYRGFAMNQRQAFEAGEEASAKKLLYVLRTALTGVHLLNTGELRVDLRTTADEYGYGKADELIKAKREGERITLPEDLRKHWLGRLDELFLLLDQSCDASPLPNQPNNAELLEDWLVDMRTRQL